MPTSRWVLAGLQILSVVVTAPAFAVPENVPAIIEGFVAKQFPGAASRFWVLNAAQWQTLDEIIVDVNAVVTKTAGETPVQHRYLLLIVAGRLAGAHSIPLDATTDCRPEEA
jgi:hypothetical protein